MSARRLGFAAVAGALALALAFAAGEAAVRALDPTPRVQIVRDKDGPRGRSHDVELLGGEPVWEEQGSEARQRLDCEAPARVVLLGSSILFGTGYAADEVVSARLSEALGPGVCVHNLAQPAFTSRSKLAVAEARLPELRPQVVVWEVWLNDPGGFVLIDGDAYNLTGRRLDALGRPVFWPAWLPVPAALHAALFRHSRLWEYATLTLAPEVEGAYEARWADLTETVLPRLRAAVEASGGELVLLRVPQLSRPFAESAALHDSRFKGYREVGAWAEAEAVRMVDLAEALAGEEVERLRHDSCCHYNPAGHAAVAEVLAPILRQRLPSAGAEAQEEPAGAPRGEPSR